MTTTSDGCKRRRIITVSAAVLIPALLATLATVIAHNQHRSEATAVQSTPVHTRVTTRPAVMAAAGTTTTTAPAQHQLSMLTVAAKTANQPLLRPTARPESATPPPASEPMMTIAPPAHAVSLNALNRELSRQITATQANATAGTVTHGKVDLFFGGRFLTSATATFDRGRIAFAHPARLVRLIPNLIGPAQVLQSLSGWLDTNTASDCRSTDGASCSPIHPTTVAVIFDVESRRADLLVNPALLVARSALADKYLPASDADVSLAQNINYAFNGADDDPYREFNLYSLTALSYKENALRVVSNLTSDDGLQVSSAVVQRNWHGKRYQTGWFATDSQDLRFAPEVNIAGVRIGTSVDTRDDLRDAAGRQLNVFLQSRGEVSVYKDNRLISTRRYDAGSHQLDTSALPGGSYDIEIRIRDSAGERVEHRFYVKNNNMPPPGAPYYFLEAGEITVSDLRNPLPQSSGEYLFRGGMDTRLNSGNSLFTGFGSTTDDSSAELGWFGLGDHYRATISGALARYQRSGVYSDLHVNFHQLELGASYRRIWGDPDEDRFGDINLIGDVQEQSSLNLSLPVGATSIELAARYNRRPDEDTVSSYSIATNFALLRGRGADLRMRLEFARDNDRNFVLATFNLRTGFGAEPPAPLTMSALQANELTPANTARTNAVWNDNQRVAGDLRAGLRAIQDPDGQTLGGNMDWSGDYGRARLQVERQIVSDDRGTYNKHTQYNGNLSTSILAAPGTLTVSDSGQDQAAVVIDVRHAARKADFDIWIDGKRRSSVRAGHKVVIALKPFQTYRIRLAPRATRSVALVRPERRVTVYPGNVVHLNWSADVVDVVSGRIVDARGRPIGNAELHGVVGAAQTDRYGLFHARLRKSSERIDVTANGRRCTVTIPLTRRLQTDRGLGALRCNQQQEATAGDPAGRTNLASASSG